MKSAFDQGMFAYQVGAAKSSNPFCSSSEAEDYRQWNLGYQYAQDTDEDSNADHSDEF